MSIWEKFSATVCAEGNLQIMWLGQAGFLFKNSKQKVLAVDIYLSDLAMKKDGNKRLTPAVISKEELKADIVLASHSHTDHLDLDSLPEILKGETKIYCSESCVELCLQSDIPAEKIQIMKEGKEIEDAGYKVRAVFADHGDTDLDAVGFLIESEGIRIYFTGDTSYQSERMKKAFKEKVHILIAPINGEYGNMNECDTAMLAKQSGADLTIPCHFWTFSRHQGNPYLFETAMRMTAPEQTAYVMAQGEILEWDNKKKNVFFN
ncbi:MBL fold metallo-hydrolase [Mediterraneibacter sp. ICN-202921]|uniref:MBL fold metallo-hydrolase n=1 Tax=Mediterraneibacter sp. ICN-202921 TaxID=3134657 RepID=UPI0030C12CBB